MKGLAGRPDPRLTRMRSDVALSTWPPLTDSRHAVLAALVFQLDRSQWLDDETIAERQYRQLAVTADFHARHQPGFAAKLSAAGLTAADLSHPENLARLPGIGRRDVQSIALATPVGKLPPKHGPTGYANTSGSTGEPVRVMRTAVNRLHWFGMTARYHLWAEDDFPGRMAVIRANMHDFGARPDWGPPAGALWDTGPGLVIDIEDDINRQLDLLADFAPTSLLAYPTNLVALLQAMERRSIALPSVRSWRTLGETLTADARERISEAHPARIYDCYSSEELGYLALQCPDNPDCYHVCHETHIIELVDDDDQPVPHGEIGRVLVTDLHNLATPMIRYGVGDHAVAGDPCGCGRGGPTLRRIMGRTRNMITKPDGTRHWPLLGYKQFRDIAPISQYQFIQHAIDQVEVRLVVDRPLTADEEASMVAHVQQKLRHPFAIDLSYFEERLPKGKNGKFEEFLSLL